MNNIGGLIFIIALVFTGLMYLVALNEYHDTMRRIRHVEFEKKLKSIRAVRYKRVV